MKPDYVMELLNKMKEKEKYLATCAWGLKRRITYGILGWD